MKAINLGVRFLLELCALAALGYWGFVTGQTLPLDDASEAKALGYCTCVAEEVAKRLSAVELADLGLGKPSAETGAKLDAVIAYCRDRAH